ncbi:hypothetical protein R0137_06195 [Congregibacter brevis]|uniref:Secreted protein n=1 Tax=Congregibacter brevis TaxID=3081201 RepID=A0ABZ0IF51_9GAMM|nr:hypothetical protein R0137_06195 [Congregibacter sp. IMCC45268]
MARLKPWRYVSKSKFRDCVVFLTVLWAADAMAQRPTIVVDEDRLLRFEGRNCSNSPIPYMLHELNRMQLEAEGKGEVAPVQVHVSEKTEEGMKEQSGEKLSEQDT